MVCTDAAILITDCLHSYAHAFAKFFVVNVNALTFVSCIVGVVLHFRLEKSSFRSSSHLRNLVTRIFASANLPTIPALIACAAFNDLTASLQGVTVNLLVAAFACAYVTYLSFFE
jgi:hypothetical protein